MNVQSTMTEGVVGGEEGFWVAAKSRRGTLAHAIFVKDLDVFERRAYVVSACRECETHELCAVGFDPSANMQGGRKTCPRCVTKHCEHAALAKALLEGKREAS